MLTQSSVQVTARPRLLQSCSPEEKAYDSLTYKIPLPSRSEPSTATISACHRSDKQKSDTDPKLAITPTPPVATTNRIQVTRATATTTTTTTSATRSLRIKNTDNNNDHNNNEHDTTTTTTRHHHHQQQFGRCGHDENTLLVFHQQYNLFKSLPSTHNKQQQQQPAPQQRRHTTLRATSTTTTTTTRHHRHELRHQRWHSESTISNHRPLVLT